MAEAEATTVHRPPSPTPPLFQPPPCLMGLKICPNAAVNPRMSTPGESSVRAKATGRPV